MTTRIAYIRAAQPVPRCDLALDCIRDVLAMRARPLHCACSHRTRPARLGEALLLRLGTEGEDRGTGELDAQERPAAPVLVTLKRESAFTDWLLREAAASFADIWRRS